MDSNINSLKDPHPRILIRILNALYDHGGLCKTHLAGASRVNYKVLLICLQILLEKKMVEISKMENGRDIVRITKTGSDALYDISKWR